MPEFDEEEFEDILEQMNILLVALSKCQYVCDTPEGTLITSGIVDFISRHQERIRLMMDHPGFTSAHEDILLSKTADIVHDLKGLDFYSGADKPFKTALYDDFLASLTDPVTYEYVRTMPEGLAPRVQKDVLGHIKEMYYVDSNEIKNGPYVHSNKGKVTEISHYRNGKPISLWIQCNDSKPDLVFKLKNDKWYQGEPSQFKALCDSYEGKFTVRSAPTMESDDDATWGTIVVGSLFAMALTTIFTKTSKTKQLQSQQKVEQIKQET